MELHRQVLLNAGREFPQCFKQGLVPLVQHKADNNIIGGLLSVLFDVHVKARVCQLLFYTMTISVNSGGKRVATLL